MSLLSKPCYAYQNFYTVCHFWFTRVTCKERNVVIGICMKSNFSLPFFSLILPICITPSLYLLLPPSLSFSPPSLSVLSSFLSLHPFSFSFPLSLSHVIKTCWLIFQIDFHGPSSGEGLRGSGASHGGQGGRVQNYGNARFYGSILFPNQPGSSARVKISDVSAQKGGGVIILNVNDTTRLDGE